MKNIFRLFILLTPFLLFSIGCGVNKKGKLRSGSRLYENTTARYNALYNANNLIAEYELGKKNSVSEDYDNFLPVYYTLPKDSSNQALANRVEEKMAAIITKHEVSKWADDSYLDLGIAQFYSGKYDDAENTFKYIIQEFEPITLEGLTYFPSENSRQAEEYRKKQQRKADKKAREEAVKQRKEEMEQKKKDREKARKERKKKVETKKPNTSEKKATAAEIKKENEKRAKNQEEKPVRKGKMTEKERQAAIKARRQAIKDREKEKRKKGQRTDPQLAENKKKNNQEKKEEKTVDKIDEIIANQEIAEDNAVEALTEEPVEETAQTESEYNGEYFFQRPNSLKKNGVIVEAYEVDEKTTDFHNPAFYEAILWLARCKTVQEEYYSADIYYRQLFTLRNVPDYVIEESYPAIADNYIQRGNHGTAIVALEEAMDSKSIDNFQKARLAYLQGQLHESLDQPIQAKTSYDKVQSYHPDYPHLMRAKLNSLKIEAIQSGDVDKAMKKLNQMSREDKNKEYLDLIYYFMGEGYLYYKEYDQAEEFYLKSLENKRSNLTEQKSAYQHLSDLYLAKPDYIKAHHYADTAATFTPPTEKYVERASQLSSIASNLENIELQDSLIELALLPEKEKVKFAKKIMKERRDREIISQVREKNDSAIKGFNLSSGTGRAGSKGNTFFAYDQKQVKSGYKKFQKEYGNRPLVDNWKYASLISSNELFAEFESSEEDDLGLTKAAYDDIFEGVPSTPEEIQAAREDIQQSTMLVGAGFYEDYPDFTLSRKFLESVIQSENSTEETKAEAYGYLMLLAKKENREGEAERIMALLDEQYPDFEYKEEEIDQTTLDSLTNQQNYFEDKYREAFAYYENGQYQQLYDVSLAMIDTISTTSPLLPKFKLLNAFAIGGLGDRTSYATSLQKISQEYHNTDEGAEAKRIIQVLDLDGEVENLGKDGDFDTNIDFARHYAILTIKNDDLVFDVRKRLDALNKKEYPNKKITLSLTRIDKVELVEGMDETENQVMTILIRSFDDKRQAEEYLDRLQSNLLEISGGDKESLEPFIVSQVNYRVLIKSSNMSAYSSFAEKYY